MPRVTSFLINRNSKSNAIVSYGCCQFLHTTKGDYTGVIPLKYVYNHLNISDRFENWIKFLKEELELDINYVIQDEEVEGYKSFEQAKAFYEKYKSQYYMSQPPQVHAGVNARISNTGFFPKSEDGVHKFCVAPYKGGNLSANNRKSNSYDALPVLKDAVTLDKFVIPIAYVDLPRDLPPNENTFKYITWFFVRYYLEYQHISNFILDNKEVLQKIVDKCDTGWYNIMFWAMRAFPTGRIDAKTSIKVTKEVIQAALDGDILRMKRDNGRFRPHEDEIYIEGAMKNHCGIENPPPITQHNSHFMEQDTPNGRFSKEVTKSLLSEVKAYIYNLSKL